MPDIAESGAPVEGLLHLAALSVGLLVAYVGIDRIHPPDDRLRAEILKSRDAVSVLLKRFDAIAPDGSVVFVYEIYALYVLCHVASQKVKLGFFKWLWNLIKFQRHVPLLPYFRNRFDIKLVSLMAAISLLLFLLLTAATVWKLEFVRTEAFMAAAYIWYVFSLIFIFVTVLASAKLLRINGTCAAMEAQINKRLQEMLSLAASANNLFPGATPER